MNEAVINILKEPPFLVPKLLLKNYKKLNITEEELLILICLINKETKTVYNPNIFTTELDMDKYKAMELLSDLTEKNIIEVKLETNKKGKKEEYIYLDLLYKKIYGFVLETSNIEPELTPTNEIYLKFESEFGRSISPTEVELINEWMTCGFSQELIEEALKEAVFNNVRNLKYIDRILDNWKQKGIKTKKDIIKDKKNYRKAQTIKEPIYDYNWLEEE